VFAQKGIKNDKNPYNYYFHVYERKNGSVAKF
ncbi:dihydrofolate reductase, partial [Enterococcus faecalis]